MSRASWAVALALAGVDGWAATRVSRWASPMSNAGIVPVGQDEWLVSFSEGQGPEVARVNARGEIVFGPSSVVVGGDGAWSGQSVGWTYTTGTQPPTREVTFRLTDRDGSPLGAPVTVSGPGLAPTAQIVMWAGGEFAVQYCSEIGSQGGCIAMSFRRIDASGALASPEMLLLRDPAGGFSEHDLVRVGDRFFSAWFYGTTSAITVSGAWYDVDGQLLTPVTAYYQAPSGETVGFNGLAARPDHVTLVYQRYDAGGATLPAEQIHVDLAGAIVDGPRQIVAEPPGLGYLIDAGQEGLGLHFTHASATDPHGIYLRRVCDDGLLGSDTFLVEQRTGAGIQAMALSHQRRAYGNVWSAWQSVSQFSHLYFEASPGYEVVVTGAGPSPAAAPVATLLQPESPSGPPVASVTAYGSSGYGVNVGSGAIAGDEVDRLLTGPGPGPGFGPQVRAFTYRGAALAKVNFYAYGTLRYGVKPRGGDLDGDVAHEVLTAPGPGAVFGPHVRGFQFDNASVQAMPKVSFYAYGTLKYGANGAPGNVDDDATLEILTGPGPGAVFGSHLRGFQYDNVAVTAMSKLSTIVFAGVTHGLAVAPGDTDWDGYDEIATAPGPDPIAGSVVAVYDFDGSGLTEKPGSRFQAFAASPGGTQLSFCQWVGEDLNRELLLSRGPLPSSTAEVKAVDDGAAGFTPLLTFDPFPGQTHGTTLASVYVGF